MCLKPLNICIAVSDKLDLLKKFPYISLQEIFFDLMVHISTQVLKQNKTTSLPFHLSVGFYHVSWPEVMYFVSTKDVAVHKWHAQSKHFLHFVLVDKILS